MRTSAIPLRLAPSTRSVLILSTTRLLGRVGHQLPTLGFPPVPGGAALSVVVCTGNSPMHAGDEHSMVAALSGISGVLKPGGLLLIDSRDWEKLRGDRPLLELPRPPLFRSGQAAVTGYTWHWPDHWDADHRVEIAVIGTDGNQMKLGRTNITYRPFTFEDLTEPLSRAGFEILSHTFNTETYVYDVTARLSASAAATPNGN